MLSSLGTNIPSHLYEDVSSQKYIKCRLQIASIIWPELVHISLLSLLLHKLIYSLNEPDSKLYEVGSLITNNQMNQQSRNRV